MQVISRAGVAWLERHQLRLNDVIHEARIRGYITRRRLDLDPDYLTAYGSDWFDFRKDGWRLEHRYKRFVYTERANGLAILNVAGIQLPDAICSKLAGSLEQMERLIEIDPGCVASECGGQITSVANKSDGSIDIRLRVEWGNTSTL